MGAGRGNKAGERMRELGSSGIEVVQGGWGGAGGKKGDEHSAIPLNTYATRWG